MHDKAWDAFITRASKEASGEVMMKEITAEEIYKIACPFNTAIAGSSPACKQAGMDCVLCRMADEDNARYASGDPQHLKLPYLASSRLNPTSAAGPDCLQPGQIRWSRPLNASVQQRLTHRLDNCQFLAGMFNEWIKAKAVPTSREALHAHITALLKKGSPGKPADPRNPKDTRGIAVSNTIMKLFSLVMVRRLTHWAINQRIIDHDQVAYLPFQGSETLFYSAVETIGLGREEGKFIAASFYDISGAFDNVKHKALWHVLDKAGLPPDFIELMKNWFPNKTAAVKVNGKVSESFPWSRGLPQGEPLSPLLWNIYFNVLLRYVEAKVKGVTLRHKSQGSVYQRTKQAYADDLLILVEGTTAEEAQARTKEALERVFEWAHAWGMSINTKPNKTEAMLFSPSFKKGDEPACFCSPKKPITHPLTGLDIIVGLDPIVVPRGSSTLQTGGTLAPDMATIHWVKSYRYLGCNITLDLDTTPLIDKKIELMEAADVRFFTGNKSIRNASNVLKIQLANTMVRSQINYLISAIPCQKEHLNSLDTALRSVGRHIFSIPRGTTNKLVEAEMPGLPTVGVILANSVRMLGSLSFLPAPFNLAPAPSLAAHTGDMTDNSSTFVGRINKLIDEWCSPRQRGSSSQLLRAILPDYKARHEVYGASKILQRTLAHYHLWADHPLANSLVGERTSLAEQQQAARNALRPPAVSQEAHLAALHCVGFRISREELLQWSYATPLSAVAPGCSGALLNYVSLPFCSLNIIRAAFAYHPYHSATRGLRTDERYLDPDEEYDHAEAFHDAKKDDVDNGADDADALAIKTTIKRYNTKAPCPLCSNENDDPYHLLCECTDGAIDTERAGLRVSLLYMLLNLCDRILQMISLSTPDKALRARVVKRVRRLQRRIVKMIRDPSKRHEEDMSFVLFRMITAIPFSARIAKTKVLGDEMPKMPLALRLGEVFDATVLQSRYMKPVANLIAKWASEHIARFAELRGKQLRLRQQQVQHRQQQRQQQQAQQ
jgi:Reverse transcriptase (RNA-dependent DNA polymerase)